MTPTLSHQHLWSPSRLLGQFQSHFSSLISLFQRNAANRRKYCVTVKLFFIPKARWDIFRVFNWFQIWFVWRSRRTNVHRVGKKCVQQDTMPGHGGHHQQSYVRVRDMDVNLSSYNLNARQVNYDLVHGHKTIVWHHLMVKISRIKLLKSQYGHVRVSRTCPFYKKGVRFFLDQVLHSNVVEPEIKCWSLMCVNQWPYLTVLCGTPYKINIFWLTELEKILNYSQMQKDWHESIVLCRKPRTEKLVRLDQAIGSDPWIPGPLFKISILILQESSSQFLPLFGSKYL